MLWYIYLILFYCCINLRNTCRYISILKYVDSVSAYMIISHRADSCFSHSCWKLDVRCLPLRHLTNLSATVTCISVTILNSYHFSEEVQFRWKMAEGKCIAHVDKSWIWKGFPDGGTLTGVVRRVELKLFGFFQPELMYLQFERFG